MKKQEEIRVQVCQGLLLIRKGTFLNWNIQRTANIWTRGLFWGVYLSSIILSQSSYILLGVFSSNMLLKNKKQNRNSGRFFLALFYCCSFSLDIRSFSSSFFIWNKLKISILNRKWPRSLFVTTAICFCSCQCEFKGWRHLQSLFLHRTVFGDWRGKGRWMSAFWC